MSQRDASETYVSHICETQADLSQIDETQSDGSPLGAITSVSHLSIHIDTVLSQEIKGISSDKRKMSRYLNRYLSILHFTI